MFIIFFLFCIYAAHPTNTVSPMTVTCYEGQTSCFGLNVIVFKRRGIESFIQINTLALSGMVEIGTTLWSTSNGPICSVFKLSNTLSRAHGLVESKINA